ncbi:hypothetical protein NLG97_g3069 [Lecanicillium saksenae]|uniref:Uncharacterized protein n=1 Tax=Lecanicillium saksenae TaxID=468837 RepID=A0ACC1R102_9HYPO|nr:hypothetical protein NLG97_g3069 [Lecanicillium saksenae]
MAASGKWLRVKSAMQPSTKPGASGIPGWERADFGVTAFRDYDAFIGTIPLTAAGEWKVGLYQDLDDDKFDSVLAAMERIPDADIYPPFDPDLAIFDEDSVEEESYHLKAPNISNWLGNDTTAKVTLSEARTNQLFLSNRHPHLGTFLGCIVRMVELKCGAAMEAAERKTIMRSIREAVVHIHSLGYAHNDISASNIMFDKDNNAVLIDLDSCVPLGEKIKKGRRVGGWRGPMFWGQEYKISSVECDDACLEYIENWLRDMERASYTSSLSKKRIGMFACAVPQLGTWCCATLRHPAVALPPVPLAASVAPRRKSRSYLDSFLPSALVRFTHYAEEAASCEEPDGFIAYQNHRRFLMHHFTLLVTSHDLTTFTIYETVTTCLQLPALKTGGV